MAFALPRRPRRPPQTLIAIGETLARLSFGILNIIPALFCASMRYGRFPPLYPFYRDVEH